MGELVLTDATIVLGTRDISGQSNSLQVAINRDALDASVFGDTTRRNVAGLKDFSASVDGLWEVNTDADLFAEIGKDDTLLGFSPQDVIGSVGFMTRISQSSYDIGAAHGSLFEANISLVGGSGIPLDRGILMENGIFTATGAGTGQQLGAPSSTQSLVGQLHVVDASGTTPTLDAIVESEADSGFATPVTRLTFAQATGKTSERLSVAGPITDDWFRFNFTIGGTSPSFTILALLAIVNN